MALRKQPTKPCYLCTNDIRDVDYKNTQLLQRFTTPQGKISPRRRTGTCARHQRKITQAIQRARIMAFVPVTKK